MRRLALYHLETLLWIARLGTFGAAAERLNTTQPAISARVREIESQLGIAIFRREGRRMVLTVRGRRLVQDCEPLWATIERTFLEADDFASAAGVVRIGSGEIAAASCLPGFVREIKETLPGVTLEIALDLTARLLEQLLAGVSDIVFLAGPVASPGIRTQSIGTVDLLWLANPRTAARMAEPDATPAPPIWSLPRHSPLHQAMIDSLDAADLAHDTVNTCNNVKTLIDIVTVGNGVALFPETMVRGLVATGVLTEVLRRPDRTILFQAAIRSQDQDPVVLEMFRRAGDLSIDPL